MNKLKDTSAEWVKINLKLLKAFDSEDGGAFGSGALLHILDHHLFVLLIMVSGLAFMATFTQELIMLRQLERLFLLNILVWLIGFNLLLLD